MDGDIIQSNISGVVDQHHHHTSCKGIKASKIVSRIYIVLFCKCNFVQCLLLNEWRLSGWGMNAENWASTVHIGYLVWHLIADSGND